MPPSSPTNTMLVLNAGSSSLKFAVYAGGQIRDRGVLEHFGMGAIVHWRGKTQAVQAKDHRQAMAVIFGLLAQAAIQPTVVAHRVVHGADRFLKPTRVNAGVEAALHRLVPLAPLHLPANLAGIKAARIAWPQAQQWAVFDTALYANLAPAVRLYALPWALARRYHIRKYGFHGISHGDAFRRAASQLGRRPQQLNAVTIHLGAGDSMTAWRRGKPVDTSMGFTPLEGLTMATRSGDLDPSIPLFLQRQAKLSVAQVERILQEHSGLYGLTGLRDIRDVLTAAGQPVAKWPRPRTTTGQRQRARLAVKMFIYDIQRYLASYLGLLPADAVIIFTGSAGQNSWLRHQVQRGVTSARGRKVVTIPTDEEAAIARAVTGVVH